MRLTSVFRIRISLNADPDQGFYLNADPDPDSGFWILIQGLFCLKVKINGIFLLNVQFFFNFFRFLIHNIKELIQNLNLLNPFKKYLKEILQKIVNIF